MENSHIHTRRKRLASKTEIHNNLVGNKGKQGSINTGRRVQHIMEEQVMTEVTQKKREHISKSKYRRNRITEK